MKKSLLILAGVLSLAGLAQAQTVTINIDAGKLRNRTDTGYVPVSGLLQLIASPSGNFMAPTTSSYVSGDNVLVLSFPMNSNGDSGTGETFNALNSLPLTTANYTLTPGEKLTLRFYPSLTSTANTGGVVSGVPSSLTPPAGTTYGQVRSDSIEFGAAGGIPTETAWVVPASGNTVTLAYVTASAQGTYINSTAFASNVVVPEPSTYVMAIGGIIALAVFARRRKVV